MGAVRRVLDRHAERPAILSAIAARAFAGIEPERAADQMRRVDVAEHDIGVGHGRLRRRPGRSTPAPAPRRRCAARSARRRRRRSTGSSRRPRRPRRDRSPAPSACSRRPTTAASRARCRRRPGIRWRGSTRRSRSATPWRWCRPCRTRSPCAMPMRRVSACTPTTPAAGPDSMMCIGVTAAALAVVRPPFDCISSSGASMPVRLTSSISRFR